MEIPIEVTRHNRRITLMIDVFYINKIPFLTSIDGTIRFQGVVPLQNRRKDMVWESLEKICSKYKLADFVVYMMMTELHWNGIRSRDSTHTHYLVFYVE